jgi:hypothetical protein
MNIAYLRLINQHIADRPFAHAEQVVAWLGAMQGQDYAGTLWAIGLRMQEATEQTIEQAVADRRIVRTWPMRGTLHFVAAQDVRWLLHLLAPRMIAQAAGRYRQLALDEATFAASQEIFAKVLQGGKQVTREELYQSLEQAHIATTGQRGYHLLVRAAQDGVICFGAPAGNQQTFTLLDEWIAPTKPLLREEALAELARRYFTSHGPATLADLMRWAGITAAEAKMGLAAVEQALIRETLDGLVYWMSPNSIDTPRNATELSLLPGFDEYILGYGKRDAVLDPAYAQAICPGGNGVYYPTIVVDGRVVGTWKRVLKKGKVQITPAPFPSLPTVADEALTAAAERYAAFLGLPLLR